MKSSIKNLIGILASSALVLALVLLTQFVQRAPEALGSVSQGSEYLATSTRNTAGTALPTLTVLKNGFGTLGSVVITGAGAGTINLYDATTSDATKRTTATSSILIVTIPTSAAAGTYTIDGVFSRGLLYEFVGTAPTTTITYR